MVTTIPYSHYYRVVVPPKESVSNRRSGQALNSESVNPGTKFLAWPALHV